MPTTISKPNTLTTIKTIPIARRFMVCKDGISGKTGFGVAVEVRVGVRVGRVGREVLVGLGVRVGGLGVSVEVGEGVRVKA